MKRSGSTLMTKVSWRMSSNLDPRFDDHGEANGLFEAEVKIKKSVLLKEATYNTRVPDDLEYGAWKK